MENVGAITFTDSLLQPKDSQTDYMLLRLHYIALHELAHMWFGDLVTMDWWDDLWLKESFADFMAATNLIENPELQNYKNANQLFLQYQNRALEADMCKTTHPIQVSVNHTEDAVNVFD
jgi:aminopeptidase N